MSLGEPRRARWLAPALAAAVAAGACEDTATVASRYLKRVHVSADSGGVVEITAEESRELAGARLTIAPGALAADTTITVEVGTTAIARRPAGPVVWFGPPGTAFRAPSRLTLPSVPYGAGQIQLLEAREEDGKRWSMPAGDPPGPAGADISRLAAFQIGWLDCLSVAFFEARPAAVQFTGIPSTQARRPTMNPRNALASVLVASCSLFGCEQPPDQQSIEQQSAEAESARPEAAFLERCHLDARGSFERCLDSSNNRGPCITRFTASIESCRSTDNLACETPSGRIPPPPPPPNPACIAPCRDRQQQVLDSCLAERGADESTCRARAGEAFRACFQACQNSTLPTPPPPPRPPVTPPPPPDPKCIAPCRDRQQQVLDSCLAERGADESTCRARAGEAFRACFQACQTGRPPTPPPPPPPPPRP